MSQVLEHIKKEIRTLLPLERFELWRSLGDEFEPPLALGEDMASVDAAWDTEIASRMKEVEEGRVELISAEEADRRTALLFAELGIKRVQA